jgi:thiol-disulfide isomerase/thioredoxin
MSVTHAAIRGLSALLFLTAAALPLRAQTPPPAPPPTSPSAPVAAPVVAPRVGAKAPELRLLPVGGSVPVSLEQFRGKPTLVVFWATWCGYCKREMPLLKRLSDDYVAKGFRVVTVTSPSRQTEQDVAMYQMNEQLPFIVLWDPQGKAMQDWAIGAFPTNFLVDAEGVVRYRGSALDDTVVQLVKDACEGPQKKT